MSRVLVVTNDFPPRPGGIQTFVHELLRRLPPDRVVVLTSRWRGWERFDAAQPFPIVRADTSVLLPTPATRSHAASLLVEHGCDAVLYGAAAPLGLLAGSLTTAGAHRQVALTHGHEAGWAQLPGARQALRRIGDGVDVVTYLGEYTRRRIAAALRPAAADRMVQLTPGVDASVFHPDAASRDRVRQRLGLGDRPVVVCVSRLMPRKGQDILVDSWPLVLAGVPDAALLLVGGGPYRSRLEQRVSSLGLTSSVILTGTVDADQLAAHYAAADVFAMPARTRRRGLDVEGLGIVYLEASATGVPVVAGRSGGAPDAVLEGETGYVVDGTDRQSLAARLTRLLTSPETRSALGSAGRAWVLDTWSWERQVQVLRSALWPDEPDEPDAESGSTGAHG
jgi:phosphatidylinositol alpha-1,6-mannosyltransferase